ncbi:MAG: hypothetical protein H6622_15095 [Halobacteriovoraceae bacterium]|nr:hypothetical protein [Halobacteriovoraceae bacterium]
MKKFILFIFLFGYRSFGATLNTELQKMRILHYSHDLSESIINKCKKETASSLCFYQIEKNELSGLILNKYFNNQNADREKIIKVLNNIFNVELSKENFSTCLKAIEIKKVPPTKLNNTQMLTDAFSKKRIFNISEYNYLLNYYIKEHNDKISILIQKLYESEQLNNFSTEVSKNMNKEIKKKIASLKLSGI